MGGAPAPGPELNMAGLRPSAGLVLGFTAAWLAGCVNVLPEAQAPAPESTAPTQRPAGKPRLKPMPIRPLQVKAECQFKDETGYAGSALVNVENDEIKAFAAAVDIPRRGTCRFNLAEFHQVKATAHVELLARNGCTVRMWEQGDQVTVAFSQCAKNCTGNAAEYLWPILVDRPSGQCN